MVVDAPVVASAPESPVAPVRTRRRRPWVVALVAVALVAVGVVVVAQRQATWKQVPALAAGAGTQVTQVACLHSGRCLIVAGGAPYRVAANGGLDLPAPLPVGHTEPLTCATRDTCLLGGSGAVFRTTNWGSSWSRIALVVNQTQAARASASSGFSVYAASCQAAACIALAAPEGAPVAPSDRRRTGALGRGGDIGSTSETGGLGNESQTATDVFTSQDSGASWTSHVLRVTLRSATCPTLLVCVALTADGVVRTTTAGRTWHARLRVPTSPGAELTDLSCPTATFCVVAGVSGDLYVTDDGTATWHHVVIAQLQRSCGPQGNRAVQCLLSSNHASTFGEQASAVACASSAYCVVSANATPSESGEPSVLLTSTDAAQTWSTESVSSTPRSWSAVDCAAASSCLAGGSSMGNWPALVRALHG